jgi:hypothetical protein
VHHDPVEQPVDDLGRAQGNAGVLDDVAAGLEEVVADQGQRVLVAPGGAVRLDERVLLLDPVRLGVDERAVEVPQDGPGGVSPQRQSSGS